MIPFILYLIKVNIALMVLYLFYKLSFTKDTFFGMRRLMLILIIITAFLYPLFEIPDLVGLNVPITGQAINHFYGRLLPEVTIFNEVPANTVSFYFLLGKRLIYIYFFGAFLLFIRTALEIGKTCYTLRRYPKKVIHKVTVCVSGSKEEPYSFFKWICLYPDAYTGKEIDEILLHERTHAREYHSIDILLAQLSIILCWFNPFIWLLRSEMRINHEYLADRKVVVSGYHKKTYQYHLLGLEHSPHQAAANLYNNFSVLPLKKRIMMLNKKRTQNIMLSKYLMYFPIVALLILFANCTGSVKEEKTVTPIAEPKIENVPVEVKTEQEVTFDAAEVMPEFPGGTEALMKYLVANIEYPEVAKKAGTQGRVVVQFIVNKDGSITDAKVVRKINESLDNEALRVSVSGMALPCFIYILQS